MFAESDINQGEESCPNDYPESLGGASSQNDCFVFDNIQCANHNPYTLGHGNAVYSQSYVQCKLFSNNQRICNTNLEEECNFTELECDNGYHQTLNPLQCSPNEISINWYNQNDRILQNTCYYGGAVMLPESPHKTGYSFSGWEVVR